MYIIVDEEEIASIKCVLESIDEGGKKKVVKIHLEKSYAIA